ncbi:hypothetical protein LTR94_026213, partial [Friedmanniomyces endolithicus]
MPVRKTAMIGFDGGQRFPFAASGVLDQRCRIPPPAGSQGCRQRPSGGRSECSANVGLALITLGDRSSLAVQAEPREELMAKGGETRAAASNERRQSAAQTGLVKKWDESGTR